MFKNKMFSDTLTLAFVLANDKAKIEAVNLISKNVFQPLSYVFTFGKSNYKIGKVKAIKERKFENKKLSDVTISK